MYVTRRPKHKCRYALTTYLCDVQVSIPHSLSLGITLCSSVCPISHITPWYVHITAFLSLWLCHNNQKSIHTPYCTSGGVVGKTEVTSPPCSNVLRSALASSLLCSSCCRSISFSIVRDSVSLRLSASRKFAVFSASMYSHAFDNMPLLLCKMKSVTNWI